MGEQQEPVIRISRKDRGGVETKLELSCSKEPLKAEEIVKTCMESWRNDPRYQLLYSLAGLVLGLACVIGGVVLFLHGATGSTNWTASFIGAKSQISDAGPGAVLFIVGLFVVWVTRFKR